jgi:hypothetical protein
MPSSRDRIMRADNSQFMRVEVLVPDRGRPPRE